MPVENSIEGNVGESYDALYSSYLYVIGEIYHKIEHCLIGTGNLENVEEVYSQDNAEISYRKIITKQFQLMILLEVSKLSKIWIRIILHP